MTLALVTGTARGIGLAIKQTLTAAGHQIIGIDLNSSDHETIACDLADPNQITAAFAEVL